MGDHPLAVDLVVANGRPPPHIDFTAIYLRSVDSVEAVAEGHFITSGNATFTNLVADWTLE